MALTRAEHRNLAAGAQSTNLDGIVFGLAIGLGAALLFVLEPMVAKMALPLFGGSPEVWTTSLVFFQLLLLAGYLYAHALRSLADLRLQVAIHAALIALAVLVLPVQIDAHWAPQVEQAPILALMWLLLRSVGLPFFALSATSSLVQSWFARSRSGARDPYIMYAASNVGSLGALLAYPLVIEPLLGTALQGRLWTAGYVCFCIALGACAWIALRSPSVAGFDVGVSSEREAVVRAPSARRCLHWVALAAVPSSLMMGATMHLSTAIAPIPLLWVLPLALYLLSFVVAFSQASVRATAVALRIVPYCVLPLAFLFVLQDTLPLAGYLAIHLAALFVLALACHGTLAALRPAPSRLTDFYLWLSVGGAAGGIFNAIVAPLIFRSVTEYPLAVVLALLLLAAGWKGDSKERAFDFIIPIALGALLLLAARAFVLPGDMHGLRKVETLAFILVAFSTIRRPMRFALTIGALLAAGALAPPLDGRTLDLERNFFGVKQVLDDPSGRLRLLAHDGTYHGTQSLDPARASEPLAYYSRSGPLGDIFAETGVPGAGRKIAVVGLGIGAAACYRRAGEDWKFYEIDPAIERIALDPTYFTFMARCAPRATIVTGDARLSLRDTHRQNALLILDAYSSDQTPVHLLTREAFQMYLANLAPHGVLAFNISNKHFDIAPVLANAAADAGLTALMRDDTLVSARDAAFGKSGSTWVAMARDGASLGGLTRDPRWHALPVRRDLPLWTDDYSSLVRVLRH
jgi:hypothetical protein